MFNKTNFTHVVFYERFTYCPCGKIPVTIKAISSKNKKKRFYLENY